jgi:hypothetical protein
MKLSFKNVDYIWENIKRHSGETFKTVTGIPYDFHVDGEYIRLHNTNWSTPKKDVENALLVKEPTVSKFKKAGFQGPSYLYGIITDNRIKN